MEHSVTDFSERDLDAMDDAVPNLRMKSMEREPDRPL